MVKKECNNLLHNKIRNDTRSTRRVPLLCCNKSGRLVSQRDQIQMRAGLFISQKKSLNGKDFITLDRLSFCAPLYLLLKLSDT
jgi:hypothetical protein